MNGRACVVNVEITSFPSKSERPKPETLQYRNEEKDDFILLHQKNIDITLTIIQHSMADLSFMWSLLQNLPIL